MQLASDVVTDRDRARARGVVDQLTRKVLAAAAGRRQGAGSGEGARSPLALGQPRRSVRALTEQRWDPDAGSDGDLVYDPVTPLGYKTAVRALPPVLSGLTPTDPRRRAATMLADTAERIDSVKGMDLGGGESSGGVSDGGATTRVKHAARFKVIEALANGWAIDRRSGRITRGPEKVARPVKRKRGEIKDIRAFPLLCAVCIEGADMKQVLQAHGWSADSKHRKTLAEAVLFILDDVADGLGLGRGGE